MDYNIYNVKDKVKLKSASEIKEILKELPETPNESTGIVDSDPSSASYNLLIGAAGSEAAIQGKDYHHGTYYYKLPFSNKWCPEQIIDHKVSYDVGDKVLIKSSAELKENYDAHHNEWCALGQRESYYTSSELTLMCNAGEIVTVLDKEIYGSTYYYKLSDPRDAEKNLGWHREDTITSIGSFNNFKLTDRKFVEKEMESMKKENIEKQSEYKSIPANIQEGSYVTLKKDALNNHTSYPNILNKKVLKVADLYRNEKGELVRVGLKGAFENITNPKSKKGYFHFAPWEVQPFVATKATATVDLEQEQKFNQQLRAKENVLKPIIDFNSYYTVIKRSQGVYQIVKIDVMLEDDLDSRKFVRARLSGKADGEFNLVIARKMVFLSREIAQKYIEEEY